MSLADLITIVNQDDRPIGNETIQKARKDGLIHRISRIMVEDKNGNIVLQKRAAKLLWPNCWDNSAAGHVDKGEDYLMAAKRELFEEIGIRADSLIELGTYFTDEKYEGRIIKRFNRAYKLVVDDLPKNIANDEVSEVRSFTLAEVKSLIRDNPKLVTSGLRDVVARYY